MTQLVSAAILLALIWVFVWPVAFGGKTTYVVISGPSMEPLYESGDLVVARQQATYEVGDVVVYKTEHGNVIHRIVGGDAASGFVLQGDNNETVDMWQPTPSDILGTSAFSVPSIGEYMLYAKHIVLTPPMPYLIAGFVFLVIVLGKDRKPKVEDAVDVEEARATESLGA